MRHVRTDGHYEVIRLSDSDCKRHNLTNASEAQREFRVHRVTGHMVCRMTISEKLFNTILDYATAKNLTMNSNASLLTGMLHNYLTPPIAGDRRTGATDTTTWTTRPGRAHHHKRWSSL